MKYILNVILFVVSTVVVFTSCSSDENEQPEFENFTRLDFGEGIYRPNPFKFLDSIPPFSWMGMPDTVKKETTFQISFNEDAIRSNSTGEIAIVDKYGNFIDGISYNGKVTKSYITPAKAKENIVKISYTVNPEVGDSILQGYIVASGVDLDEANRHKLENLTPIAVWELNHETGINWLRWAILILIVLLVCIIYAIVKGVVESFSAISLSGLGLPLFNMFSLRKYSSSDNNKKIKRKQKYKSKKRKRIIEKLLCLEKKLYANHKVYYKYDTLEEIRQILNLLQENDISTFNDARIALKSNTWSAFEDANRLWDPVPVNNVKCTGSKSKTYKLEKSHKLYDKCRSLKFTKCKYDEHASPDFGNATYKGSIIDITDLYESLSCDALQKRGGSTNSLQELAQMRMAENLKGDIIRWANKNNCDPDFWKWRNAHDLVPHEDTNCRTMRLVYRPVHSAFLHRGGIANAINIKSHFNNL